VLVGIAILASGHKFLVAAEQATTGQATTGQATTGQATTARATTGQTGSQAADSPVPAGQRPHA
jgi:hypothetical protein